MFVLPAAIYFITHTKLDRRHLTFIISMVSTAIAFIYFNFLYHYAIQTILFMFGVLTYGKYVKFDKSLFKYMGIMLLLVIISDIVLNNSNFIYTHYYGRGRLQLGFSHPKEAGNYIVCLALVYYISRGVLDYKFSHTQFTIFIALVIVLYFVQSRNALITFILIVLSNRIICRYGHRALYLALFAMLPIITMFLISFLDTLSILSSGRLMWWITLISQTTVDLKEHAVLDGVIRYNFDNYFLNLLFATHWFMVVTALVFLIYLQVVSTYKQLSTHIVIPLIIGALFNSIWDSGMFSTGSIYNIFTWVLILQVIRKRYA